MLPNKFQKKFSSSPLGEPEGACKVLIIGNVWPEPTTTAAGNRMLQLLEAFLSYDYQITFATTASKTSYSHDLIAMGIEEEQVLLNDSSFDDFVRSFQPDIVVFDRFMVEEQFGWHVAEACPKALRILNTEDLHSLREYRENCFKKSTEWSILGWQQQDKTKREMASIYRSDLTLLVSTFETELLTKYIRIDDQLLLHLPFMLDAIDDKMVNEWPNFEERSDFITFGNGYHAPNVDSFRYLKQIIWPLIRKELPFAKLHVYGAYLPQQIQELHQPEQGFLVHGWTENIDEKVSQSKVVLAPLRFGAGIKGKLTKAMQQGTPSVTTSIGAEGMGARDWPGHIADDPNHFARQATQLYQDEKLWNDAQQKGVSLINAFYDKEKIHKSLFIRLEALCSKLKAHRDANFIGSLVQHQSLAATKFMGKWIEEKNRLD